MNVLLTLLFLVFWASLMGSIMYFSWHVAPAAVRRWADEHGYQLGEQWMAGPLDWSRNAKGSGHQLYRIVVVDQEGESRSGVAVVGIPSFPFGSIHACPVEVRWDPPGSAVRHLKPVSETTVNSFATADTTIAVVLVAFVLGLPFVINHLLKGIPDGLWGLFRDPPGAAFPGRLENRPVLLLQLLGLLACCSAAMVTLAAGGIGMRRRRLWGYHAHLAGSLLLCFTGLGTIYGFPSLIFSIRPQFRAYFRQDEKPKSKLSGDPLLDL